MGDLTDLLPHPHPRSMSLCKGTSVLGGRKLEITWVCIWGRGFPPLFWAFVSWQWPVNMVHGEGAGEGAMLELPQEGGPLYLPLGSPWP